MLQLMLIVGLIAAVYYHFKIKPMPAAERKKCFGLPPCGRSGAAINRCVYRQGTLARRRATAAFALLRTGFYRAYPRAFWLAKNGGVARFTTEHIAAELDVNQMNLNGHIKQGLYANYRLDQLDKSQLEELLEHYQSRDKNLITSLKPYYNGAGFTANTPARNLARRVFLTCKKPWIF